jgi:hypothetical protein
MTDPRYGLAFSWQGWDGSTWALSDPLGGVYLHAEGVEGLGAPSYIHHTQTAPGLAGQWHRSSVAEPRRIFWPLTVEHSGDELAFIDRDTAFWRTLDPERPGTWTVMRPDGAARSILARFVDDGKHVYTHDPVRDGWEVYGLSLVADDPYWRGAEVTRSWRTSDAGDFYGGAAKAPSFYLASSNTLGSATVENPGDVEAWPVWTITGPFTTASVGVDGATIEAPIELAAGEALVIDTDPTVQTALVGSWDEATRTLTDPVDRTADLGSVEFAPLPARGAVPLSIALAGTGYVSATFTPRYWRAY